MEERLLENDKIELKSVLNEKLEKEVVFPYEEDYLKSINQAETGTTDQVTPEVVTLVIAFQSEMTIPDKPNSRLQKYRLTQKGLELKKQLSDMKKKN